MAPVQSFRELLVWQRSIELALTVYKLTSSFPRDEIYGLTSQLRRASVSVASNIAEGQGRATTGEFRQFLGMARGSNFEVQTQLVIASELGYGEAATVQKCDEISLEVGKMLNGLLRSL
jgi:four helix bundle protein